MLNLLKLIYPDVCAFCNKIQKESLCKKCEEKIKKYKKETDFILKPVSFCI